MKAHYLGHVVFYVKDLQRSLAFYRDLLGFKEIGRVFNGTAAALTSGRTHHELLLIRSVTRRGHRPGGDAGSIISGSKWETVSTNCVRPRKSWSRLGFRSTV